MNAKRLGNILVILVLGTAIGAGVYGWTQSRKAAHNDLRIVHANGDGQDHGTPLPEGRDDEPLPDDYCPTHRIPESICAWCNPELIEAFGFCHGHDVPEAFCSRCSPALIPAFKVLGDWCAEHGLPESQCRLCNPDVPPGGTPWTPPAGGESPIELVATDNDLRSRRSPQVNCTTNERRIRFNDPKVAEQIGLEYARVSVQPLSQTVTCNARVTYDGNRYIRLSARVPGVVKSVAVDLGEAVAPGDILAEIDSADLAAAKGDYRQAESLVSLWDRNAARERELLDRGLSTEKDLLEVETRLAEAHIAREQQRQRLRLLGISPQDMESIATGEDTASVWPLTAPFAGVVVERSAVIGESVDTSQPLFALTDTSRMWAMLELNQTDINHIRRGLPVVLHVDGLSGESFGGYVTWVSSQVDPRTRLLPVRVEIDNPEGLLRANMYGKAVVTVHDKELVTVVPKEAVQWEGCCNVVFARVGDALFEPRKVRLGYETERIFEVHDGIAPGETVVTTGSFLLKTELLKGSIGAGCCEVGFGRLEK